MEGRGFLWLLGVSVVRSLGGVFVGFSNCQDSIFFISFFSRRYFRRIFQYILVFSVQVWQRLGFLRRVVLLVSFLRQLFCKVLKFWRGIRVDSVINCRSRVFFFLSKVFIVCQNQRTMLLSVIQCLSRVLDFQSFKSILFRSSMISWGGGVRYVIFIGVYINVTISFLGFQCVKGVNLVFKVKSQFCLNKLDTYLDEKRRIQDV